ncbi:uncharacterized protein METZ01_LOCUS43847 [marine metagenome]|uniref:Uncharacterized protein n=1 Tax=marine metagenome TaxID=408172 RepID=A0A381RQ70_9ZZZZ
MASKDQKETTSAVLLPLLDVSFRDNCVQSIASSPS